MAALCPPLCSPSNSKGTVPRWNAAVSCCLLENLLFYQSASQRAVQTVLPLLVAGHVRQGGRERLRHVLQEPPKRWILDYRPFFSIEQVQKPLPPCLLWEAALCGIERQGQRLRHRIQILRL